MKKSYENQIKGDTYVIWDHSGERLGGGTSRKMGRAALSSTEAFQYELIENKKRTPKQLDTELDRAQAEDQRIKFGHFLRQRMNSKELMGVELKVA